MINVHAKGLAHEAQVAKEFPFPTSVFNQGVAFARRNGTLASAKIAAAKTTDPEIFIDGFQYEQDVLFCKEHDC